MLCNIFLSIDTGKKFLFILNFYRAFPIIFSKIQTLLKFNRVLYQLIFLIFSIPT